MIEDEQCMAHLIIPHLDRVMEMIEKNIFRPLPSIKKVDLDKQETGIDAVDTTDPAWPYLQGIYEILHMIITSNLVEVNMLKSFIKARFVEEFLALFESEEPLERDILKNILHKMYAKVSKSIFSNLF